jgi:hypothetical protein
VTGPMLPADDPARRLSRDGLLEEIARLRGSSKSKREAEAIRRYETAEARAVAALAALDAAKATAGEAGIEGEEFAGHPAVSSFRRAWRGLTSALLRLPAERARGGFSSVELLVAKAVIPDLDLFELLPPRGKLEARRRDVIRRCFTHPGRLAVLSAPGPHGERFRALVMREAARLYFRPSLWRVYERSAEDRDRYAKGRAR